jgi:hypothetical protein
MRTVKSIECVTTLRLTYDSESKAFVQAFTDYKESIYPKSTVDEMLSHVANYVLKFGSDRLIEGVGYLSVNGVKQGEPFSGIDLETDDFNFDFDVTEELPY